MATAATAQQVCNADANQTIQPSDAKIFACPEADSNADLTADLNASNRIKGFLGMTGEIVPALPADPVAHVKALTNEELFPLGEKALRDIADDIIVLDEIRNRFRAANGVPILSYASWREFVEKNSLYSIRTIQNRLADKNGKDLTKVNAQPGNMYTRKSETIEVSQCSWCGGTKGTPAEGEKLCPSCKAAAQNARRPVPISKPTEPTEPTFKKGMLVPAPSDWLEGYAAGHAAGYTAGFLASTEGKEVHFSERLKVGDKVWVAPAWYRDGTETHSQRVVSKITNKIVTLEPNGQLDKFCLPPENDKLVGYCSLEQRYPKKDDGPEFCIIGRVEEAPTLELAKAAEDAGMKKRFGY